MVIVNVPAVDVGVKVVIVIEIEIVSDRTDAPSTSLGAAPALSKSLVSSFQFPGPRAPRRPHAAAAGTAESFQNCHCYRLPL
ncbi:uncharacterized protein ACLA_096180 [Aspergillus clavatus NRRL 1]|uniref:Uncharacterized protein n=1 Tax=Aspergillus clavatus (strain ATCC 1007 / CBS 513.65 / DSM 816 / NCTC 3887 / NRRL 1 / QM 1276 / 107) TaxID=344612 RepID=A1CM98_ASPCL|nr:uncharacterized protein ACLA_096180 [Aspergillus clavatus NRRL 1]EAW08685.1 hypothetical protein ACLA_096180 [Aspergillus clavatus NRRL 1]